MNDKHLATRAKLILRELQMRSATLLHAWMAQYIAECLETLERDPTDIEMKDRCAATIARLWQAYVEDRRHSFAHAGDDYRTRARLADDVLAELRAELSNIDDVAKTGAFESSVRLRHLTALEEQVLEVYGASASLHAGRDNKAALDEPGSDEGELIELLAELRRESAPTAQQIAASVFPEFADLDLENVDAVERAALVALRSIDRARRQRLGNGTASNSANDTSTKRRTLKKSNRKPTRPDDPAKKN